jgi:orotate phosphoribosyltransferase
MEKIQQDFLDLLTKKGGLKIASSTEELFVLKSGRKSPYFINTGALTDGESLVKLKRSLASFIASLIKRGEIEDFEFIFGPAYKGINLAVLACEGLKEFFGMNKRFLYDRKEEKAYGDVRADKVIVGANYFKPGDRILIIDDVITTGKTKIEAINKLKLLGEHKIVGLVLVVDRQEKLGDAERVEDKSAVEYLQKEFGIKVFPFLTTQTLFGLVKDKINEGIRKSWIDYYKKYGVVELR